MCRPGPGITEAPIRTCWILRTGPAGIYKSDQIRGVVKNLGADVEHSMAAAYAGVYIDYYAGREIDVKGIKSTKGYRFWERNMPDSYLIRELDAMIADSDRDNNYFLLPEEEGWLTGD